LAVILFLLLCGSILFNLVFVAKSFSVGRGRFVARAPEFEEETVENGTRHTSDKIAQITLHGVISTSVSGSLGDTMVDDLKIALRQAIEDKHVKAIVLYVDSPGGEVTASDMIYDAVKKAREKKPVVIYMGSLAAS